MISFKLKKETHGTVGSCSRVLCKIGYVASLAFFAYTIITSYLRANDILADHRVVEAQLGLSSIAETSGRRGRTKQEFVFGYRFEVDGVPYAGSFTTSESNADKYLSRDSIPIAISNVNQDFDRMSLLERNHSVGSIVMRLGIAAVVLAFLMAALHLIISERLFVLRDEDRSEEEGSEEGAEKVVSAPEQEVLNKS